MSTIFMLSALVQHRQKVALDLHRRHEIARGHRMTRRPRIGVGKHFDPVLVEDRPERPISDPYRHLNDVLGRTAGGAYHPAHIFEHQPALRIEVIRALPVAGSAPEIAPETTNGPRRLA